MRMAPLIATPIGVALSLAAKTSSLKATHSALIIEALPRCQLPSILIVPLVSLITNPKALILLILEPSKFNLNLLLIGGIYRIHF